MTNQISENVINYKRNGAMNRVNDYYIVYYLLVLFSLISCFVTLLSFDGPEYYDALFLLPLSFIILLLINTKNINEVFTNFGVILIIALEFIRLVVSPMFLVLSGYYEIIKFNVAANTPKAIGLLVYETIIIAIALRQPIKIRNKRPLSHGEFCCGISRLHKFMALYTSVLLVVCLMAPDILLAHRTIIGAFTDKSFTSMTLDTVIAANPTGLKHYMLMISRLLITPYRLLLPAYLIIVLRYYLKKRNKWLAWLISFFPFLMVNDVIAQSVYFTMFLLLMNCFMDKVSYKVIVLILVAAVSAVIIYFLGRFLVSKNDGDSLIMDFAERSVTYFSGLNLVSGSFNQPWDLGNKYQYFLYDFLKAIPFNKTLLGLDTSISSDRLFHSSNFINFEIPTTIGMCYYYFGALFAPLYSFVLARFAKRSSIKLQKENIPLLKVVYMFAAFIFSLGIVMYNVEIACTTLVQIVLPIYIIAKISFRRRKSDT